MAFFLNDLVLLMGFSQHAKIRTIVRVVGLAMIGIPIIAASLLVAGTMLLGLYSIVIAL